MTVDNLVGLNKIIIIIFINIGVTTSVSTVPVVTIII